VLRLRRPWDTTVHSRRGLIAALTVIGWCMLALAGNGVAPAHAFADCEHYIASARWAYDVDPWQAVDLQVTPTQCGRADAKLHPLDAFNEAIRKAGGALNRSSLYHQFQCHAIFAASKAYWDLEPWRKDAGLGEQIIAKCNPPAAAPVAGVGVGQGVSTAAGVAFQAELSRAGGPPALGEPHLPVLHWGLGCIQFFFEGSRGPSAILSTGCAPATTYWVGDYVFAYYQQYGSSAGSVIGFPYNDSHRWGRGWVQDFNGGQRGPNIVMRGDGRADVHDVYGAIRSEYVAVGGGPGQLGFPTSDQYPWCGMTRQDFLGGSIVAAPTDGAHLLTSDRCGSPAPAYVHHVRGTCADGACGLNERSGPGYSAYPVVGKLYDGNEVDIVCQTRGQSVAPNHGVASNVWDRLTGGAYVTDVYVDTAGVGGSFSSPIPQC
jgi:Protein of unknown function (DUF2599)